MNISLILLHIDFSHLIPLAIQSTTVAGKLHHLPDVTPTISKFYDLMNRKEKGEEGQFS